MPGIRTGRVHIISSCSAQLLLSQRKQLGAWSLRQLPRPATRLVCVWQQLVHHAKPPAQVSAEVQRLRAGVQQGRGTGRYGCVALAQISSRSCSSRSSQSSSLSWSARLLLPNQRELALVAAARVLVIYLQGQECQHEHTGFNARLPLHTSCICGKRCKPAAQRAPVRLLLIIGVGRPRLAVLCPDVDRHAAGKMGRTHVPDRPQVPPVLLGQRGARAVPAEKDYPAA